MTGTGERASQPGDSGLVLVLNSGSSSVKFALVHPGSGQRVTDGLAERVGTPEAVLRIRPGSSASYPRPGRVWPETIRVA